MNTTRTTPYTPISTKGWSYENLLRLSKNFAPAKRIHVSRLSEGLKDVQVESDPVPVVIEGWHQHPAWSSANFSLDAFVDQSAEEISVRNIRSWSDQSINLKTFVEKCRSTPIHFVQDETERLYGKDADCPTSWIDWLTDGKAVPVELAPYGPTDLLRYRPENDRIHTLMCYLGVGDTFTPCHKDLCASTGHNLMTYTENGGSSFWFMAEGGSAGDVARYFQRLGQELDHENYVVSLSQWAKAPFKVYIIEQKLGDLVLVPPRSCHQVVNQGGISLKVSWSRMTPRGLSIGYYHELPIYRRVCRNEIYRVKATLYHAIRGLVAELSGDQQPNTFPSEQLLQTLKSILPIYDSVLIEDATPPDTDPHCDPVAAETAPEFLCDFCGTDIFQSFFECDTCVHGPEKTPYTICSWCYVEGRSCRCRVMEPKGVRPYTDLLDLRERAATILQKGRDAKYKVPALEASKIAGPVFASACMLRKMRLEEITQAAGNTKRGAKPKEQRQCFASKYAGGAETHSTTISSWVKCKPCHYGLCFEHALVLHRLHSLEILSFLSKDDDESGRKYHDHHSMARDRDIEDLKDLRRCQQSGDPPPVHLQVLYNASVFTDCRPHVPDVSTMGFYDRPQASPTPTGQDCSTTDSSTSSSTGSTSSLSSIPSTPPQDSTTFIMSRPSQKNPRGERKPYVLVPPLRKRALGASDIGEAPTVSKRGPTLFLPSAQQQSPLPKSRAPSEGNTPLALPFRVGPPRKQGKTEIWSATSVSREGKTRCDTRDSAPFVPASSPSGGEGSWNFPNFLAAAIDSVREQPTSSKKPAKRKDTSTSAASPNPPKKTRVIISPPSSPQPRALQAVSKKSTTVPQRLATKEKGSASAPARGRLSKTAEHPPPSSASEKVAKRKLQEPMDVSSPTPPASIPSPPPTKKARQDDALVLPRTKKGSARLKAKTTLQDRRSSIETPAKSKARSSIPTSKARATSSSSSLPDPAHSGRDSVVPKTCVDSPYQGEASSPTTVDPSKSPEGTPPLMDTSRTESPPREQVLDEVVPQPNQGSSKKSTVALAKLRFSKTPRPASAVPPELAPQAEQVASGSPLLSTPDDAAVPIAKNNPVPPSNQHITANPSDAPLCASQRDAADAADALPAPLLSAAPPVAQSSTQDLASVPTSSLEANSALSKHPPTTRGVAVADVIHHIEAGTQQAQPNTLPNVLTSVTTSVQPFPSQAQAPTFPFPVGSFSGPQPTPQAPSIPLELLGTFLSFIQWSQSTQFNLDLIPQPLQHQVLTTPPRGQLLLSYFPPGSDEKGMHLPIPSISNPQSLSAQATAFHNIPFMQPQPQLYPQLPSPAMYNPSLSHMHPAFPGPNQLYMQHEAPSLHNFTHGHRQSGPPGPARPDFNSSGPFPAHDSRPQDWTSRGSRKPYRPVYPNTRPWNQQRRDYAESRDESWNNRGYPRSMDNGREERNDGRVRGQHFRDQHKPIKENHSEPAQVEQRRPIPPETSDRKKYDTPSRETAEVTNEQSSIGGRGDDFVDRLEGTTASIRSISPGSSHDDFKRHPSRSPSRAPSVERERTSPGPASKSASGSGSSASATLAPTSSRAEDIRPSDYHPMAKTFICVGPKTGNQGGVLIKGRGIQAPSPLEDIGVATQYTVGMIGGGLVGIVDIVGATMSEAEDLAKEEVPAIRTVEINLHVAEHDRGQWSGYISFKRMRAWVEPIGRSSSQSATRKGFRSLHHL